jgi:Tol biopolymer transport system component
VAGLLVVAVVAGATVFRPALQQWAARLQPLPTGGRLLLPTDGGLAVYSLAERRQSVVVPVSMGQTITASAWAPDASQVAYGLFHRRQGDPALSSEIYVAEADGSNARPLAERDRPGAVLDAPVWSPDGQQVYFAYVGQVDRRLVQRIERIRRDGSDRQPVVDNAYAPEVSPDGRRLLFLRDERVGSTSGTSLWSIPTAGGEARRLIPVGRYPGLAYPRFSPDGRRIAVSILNSMSGGGPLLEPLAWLLPTAYAHGLPWDIWTLDADGGDPRRLTDISADDPSVDWSPDGRHLAIWSGTGLYLVAADGTGLQLVSDRGGYGAFDWAR